MEWDWPQPIGKWKVRTDKSRGIIKVKDEKGNTLLERKGLSEAVIQVIEDNFLNIVAREDKPNEDIMFQ